MKIAARVDGTFVGDDMVEKCKPNDVDPLGHMTDVLSRIVHSHQAGDIDPLLPWPCRKQDLPAVA